jgi:membrane protease YdiL (CAAX protease family)
LIPSTSFITFRSGAIGAIVEWVLAIALLAVIFFWERLPLSSIGIHRVTVQDVLWGVGGFLLGLLTFFISAFVFSALHIGTTATGVKQLAAVPIGWRAFIVLTAGITEEILFRGYPIERLNMLTGRLGLSAALAYLIFVMVHIPLWGLGGAIQIGLWSIVVTGLYVWRRRLVSCMVMHILNDGFAFIIVPLLFAPYLR